MQLFNYSKDKIAFQKDQEWALEFSFVFWNISERFWTERGDKMRAQDKGLVQVEKWGSGIQPWNCYVVLISIGVWPTQPFGPRPPLGGNIPKGTASNG